MLFFVLSVGTARGNDELQARKRTVTGTVISAEDNTPIVGATVWLKNSNIGASTGQNGTYSITIDGAGGVLTFSYLGKATQEIEIGARSVIDVELTEDIETIDDVVVVGFGYQKKESVVGAISTLDMTNVRVSNASLSTALAGQLAGVVAMNRSGEPGKASSAEFYIRGVSSFTGGNHPLILIDGIERDIDLIDTEDIAAFSILKDAAASAVYGVRGANGVILIATKKGLEGKPVINARFEAGINQPTRLPKFANAAQWTELYNEMLGQQYFSPEVIEKHRTGADPDLYPDVDWMKALYKPMAFNQKINLNVGGGNDICSYYVAGAFYNEGSIYRNAGDIYEYDSSIHYTKYNFRANLNFNVTKTTVLNVNLANIYEKAFAPGEDSSNIWRNAFDMSPHVFPKEYSDGSPSAPAIHGGENPWNMLVHTGYREQFWNSSQSLIGISQNLDGITKGLRANIKFSWDAFNTSTQMRRKTVNAYYAKGRNPDGSLNLEIARKGSEQLTYEKSTEGSMTTYLEGSLEYDRLFGDKNRVGALLLYNHKIHNNTQTSDRFLSLPYKNQGIAGRVTYSFDNRYFAEFNMGYNGSENFASGYRFGFFPAGALGWMISNEEWFKPAGRYINMLKLKGSYGLVGNDDIGGGRWIYKSTIVERAGWQYGRYGGEAGGGIQIGNVENLHVSWQKAYKMNVGLEVNLFNKLNIQADYFNERRNGIFIPRAGLPDVVGIGSQNIPKTNIGKSLNQGFDGTIEYEQRIGNWFLTARGNFTYNRNRLLDNDEPDRPYKYQNRIGKPFGSAGNHTFGLLDMGLFESQEEIDNSPDQMFGSYRVGDIKYKDVNGDGLIDSYDEVAIGYTNLPEIIYGFGVTAQWKDLDINLFFQGIGHVSFWTSGRPMYPFSTGNTTQSAINADIFDNVWKTTNTPEQNAKAIYPRMSISGGAGSSNNNRISTFNMRDGSFLRLKNFEVGYSLPKRVVGNTFIKSMRFYVSGTNLLTFSKFKLWDVELGSTDGSVYPPSRTILIGLTAKF